MSDLLIIDVEYDAGDGQHPTRTSRLITSLRLEMNEGEDRDTANNTRCMAQGAAARVVVAVTSNSRAATEIKTKRQLLVRTPMLLSAWKSECVV